MSEADLEQTEPTQLEQISGDEPGALHIEERPEEATVPAPSVQSHSRAGVAPVAPLAPC